MNNTDAQYLALLNDVMVNGANKTNRTGVSTKSVFGRQLRFDLSEGFPILTTKKVHFKSVVQELLFFLRGETNVQSLKDNGVTIWNEWANADGELGKIYGYQWINWENKKNIVPVECRKCTHELEPKRIELQEPEFSEDKLVGKIFDSINYGKFIVLRKTRLKDTHSEYEVQFLRTGYLKAAIRTSILKGNVKDPYYPRIYNVAYCGKTKLVSKLDKNIKKTWMHMLDRCYNPKCKEYKFYGEKGIVVCPKWLNFDKFYEDVRKLPQWYHKKNNLQLYQLDKDYFQSDCYCSNTCVWLSKVDNVLYNRSKPFEVIDEAGKVLGKEISNTECGIRYNLCHSKISMVLLGKREHHKGFKFKYINDGKAYRYQLPTNQIAEVINKIKTNPNDRRLVVSAWNVSDLDSMKLPPCHMLFEFNVCGDRLNCIFFMRSIDVFLGLPFNISSYALLTHMISHVCGLKAGELIWFGGDTHIYNNHFDQVCEQLNRTMFDLPVLKLSNKIMDIFDFKFEDIELVGYNCHPSIKAPIAV